MSIQNPYQGVEHKVFKRTFLQETEVGVDFEIPMTTEDFRARMVPFIRDTFNLEVPKQLDKATERAELTSNDGQVKFVFNLNSAKVVIGNLAYQSFSSSAIKYLLILVDYVKKVACAESVRFAYINKINVWPIESKNSKQTFAGASLYIFKREHIEDIANLKFEDSAYPVGATKEAVINCGDSASLKAVIRVELKDATKTNFSLGLRAQALNVNVNDIISDFPKLNEIIFGAFTDIVSDNIFDLMSKDDSNE